MSKNKVTQEQIAKLISEAKIDVATVQEKCTVVTVTLKSGFILIESECLRWIFMLRVWQSKLPMLRSA